MAVALFLMEINIPALLIADYAETMDALGIDIDSFATFDDDKVEAMAKALKTAKVRPGHVCKIRRAALKRRAVQSTAQPQEPSAVVEHTRMPAELLTQHRAEPAPTSRREWYDDDEEMMARKRAVADYQENYHEALLLMDPQTIAAIGGRVKMHHDIRVARERGDPVPATAVYTFK